MNLTEKALHNADNCRFCWMCHHICPVGNATGLERNTARARALALSLVAHGGAQATPDIIDNLYECTLCGGCTNDCYTGFDPIVFTKEARTEAVLAGMMPDYVERLISNFEAYGNVYGEKTLDVALCAKIAEKSRKTAVLLFLGTDARYKAPDAAGNAIAALDRAKVNFTVLSDEPDSGYAFDTLLGATAETTDVMKTCAAKLNEFEEVIVFDPADAKIFTREYKQYGVTLSCRVTTFTAKCAELLQTGAIRPQNTGKTYTFQDPALLAREVGETEEPRVITRAVGTLRDMQLCGKQTMFAGNLLMNEYMKDVMHLIAKKRWENAMQTGADALVTASVSENAVLAAVKPDCMALFSVEQLMLFS